MIRNAQNNFLTSKSFWIFKFVKTLYNIQTHESICKQRLDFLSIDENFGQITVEEIVSQIENKKVCEDECEEGVEEEL